MLNLKNILENNWMKKPNFVDKLYCYIKTTIVRLCDLVS